ncbi:MAG: hypothetical protein WC712_14715 [Candidatus Brocadiia bacterium]
MKRTSLALMVGTALFVIAALLKPLPAEQPAAGDTVVKLTYVTMKDMADYFTPKHLRRLLVSSLDLPNGKSRGIPCNVAEQFVEFDTDLDGKPDTRIAQGGKTVEVMISDEAGKKRKYPILLWHDLEGDRLLLTGPVPWYYSTLSAVSGIIEGKRFFIIDDNCNGAYNDFGADAIVFAPAKGGWYLTPVMELGKGLIELTVEADGSSASYHPFSGPTGSVDPLSKLSKGSFKPQLFGVKIENRTFGVLRPDGKPSLVPVGKYSLEGAVIDRMIEVLRGSLPAFDIVQDATAKVEWGGPFTMLFMQSPGPDYPRAFYSAEPGKHTFYCEPPYFKGEHGEVYVGSKDWCSPDRALESSDPENATKFFCIAEKATFTIEILEPKSRKVVNPLKFYTAAQLCGAPGFPAAYFWQPFIWDYRDLRGTYLLRVTCPTSKAFKEAVYEEKIDLK